MLTFAASVLESVLELALESAYFSSVSADFKADAPVCKRCPTVNNRRLTLSRAGRLSLSDTFNILLSRPMGIA